MNLFGFTRVVLKFNEVMDVSLKEGSEILSYDDKLDLIGIRWRIEYKSHQIDSISNNYDMWSVI